MTLSIGLLIVVSLAVGSLRIVEAVGVSPELDAVASAQATLAETASNSAVSMTTAPASLTVSRVPRNAPAQQPVTSLGQTLPDDATPADTPTGAASEYPPADVAQAPPAAAIHTEARDGETEIETAVDVIPPQASPTNEPSQTPNAQPVTPWTAAADAGVSLGQRSKEGGVAAARFFSRFGKRIANAF